MLVMGLQAPTRGWRTAYLYAEGCLTGLHYVVNQVQNIVCTVPADLDRSCQVQTPGRCCTWQVCTWQDLSSSAVTLHTMI